MRTLTLSPPQLALIVATRAMAAAGIALLLADRLDRSQRRAVGATLVAVGVLTTVPLAAEVMSAARGQRPVPVDEETSGSTQTGSSQLATSR